MSSRLTFEDYQAGVLQNLPITQSSRPVRERVRTEKGLNYDEELNKENEPVQNPSRKTNKNHLIAQKRKFLGFAAPPLDDDPFEDIEETSSLPPLPENVQFRTNSTYVRAQPKVTAPNAHTSQASLQTPSVSSSSHPASINRAKQVVPTGMDSPIPSILGKRMADGPTPSWGLGDSEEDNTVKKSLPTSTRCKMVDLPRALKALSRHVVADYKAVLATRCPFPDITEEQTIAGAAIIRGTKKLNVDVESADYLDMLINIVIARDSHFRSDPRTKVIPLVNHYYGFDKAVSNKATFHNRKLHAELKHEDSFLFKQPNNQTGLYEHPVVQAAINDMWFKDSGGLGIKFEAYFTPFPLTTLGIVFTAIEYVIDCWATGKYNTEKQFTAKDYHDVYKKHIGTLVKTREYSKNSQHRLFNICNKLLENARRHAGVQASSEYNTLDDYHIAAFEQASSSSDEDEEGDDQNKKDTSETPSHHSMLQSSNRLPARKKSRRAVESDNENEGGSNTTNVATA